VGVEVGVVLGDAVGVSVGVSVAVAEGVGVSVLSGTLFRVGVEEVVIVGLEVGV
jgi:hypothetical protein